MKRILAVILAILILSTSVTFTAFAQTAESNKSLSPESLATYTGKDLGATYSPESTTFKVWAPTASKVTVKLYSTGSDKESGAGYLCASEMEFDSETGVWSAEIEGDYKNVYYTYAVEVKIDGKVKVNEVVDIYAKAVGVNGNRGMVVDLASTNPDGWENDKHVTGKKATDAVVWEIHIKDFSYDESSGVSEANRGKYLAFTESTTLNGDGKTATCVDYLKNLGVTHVQINPFYDFATVDEAGDDTQFNWGYDPKNYNVPEGSYSSNPYDGNVRINECKQMIQALHNAGIGVIMDVVYNHTYLKDSWFNLTVPDYYYRKTASGAWSNGSGCGNDTASERLMFKEFMVNSVTYWAEEYHIDGFRFDLMGLHDVDTMNAIRDELDGINPNILTYGEAWDLSTSADKTNWTGNTTRLCTQKNLEHADGRIAAFNDGIRDGIKGSVFNASGKGYIQGNAASASSVAGGISLAAWAVAPTQVVSYSSCHDNQTLYDRLVRSMIGNSEEDYKARNDELVLRNKLAAVSVFSAPGISFMLAGEEFARTKLGDENSYKSSPDINKLDWNRIKEFGDLVSYYGGLIELRKAFAPLRDSTNASVETVRFTKISEGAPSGVLAFTMDNTIDSDSWKTLAVVMNSLNEDAEVKLYSKGNLPENWVIVANCEEAGVVSLGEISGDTVKIPALSTLILADKESFDKLAIKSTRGRVEIKHVDADSKETLKTNVLTGVIGTSYSTSDAKSLSLRYDLDKVEGNTDGSFTAETQSVTYYYKKFTPEMQDVSGDGKTSMEDVTTLQKHIAKLITINSDLISNADYDGDKAITMNDVTMLQKYIAKLPVGIGQLVTRFVALDENGKETEIAPSVTQTQRMGTDYKTTPADISYYTLDESKLPSNAEGKYSANTTTVTYYYTFEALKRTVHVKHMGGGEWVPYLYYWENSGGNSPAWPGVKMTDDDGDGWYEYTIEVGGEFNIIISNNGSPQTIDYTGYNSDLWVYINVDTLEKTASDLTIMTKKP